MADKLTFEELKRQSEEFRRKALASFPYAVVQAPGNQALTTWTDIRDSGQGSPVVVGGDEALGRVIEGASEWPGVVKKTTAELLEVASRIRPLSSLPRSHTSGGRCLGLTSFRCGARMPPCAEEGFQLQHRAVCAPRPGGRRIFLGHGKLTRGHAAGNGRYSQSKPTATMRLLYSENTKSTRRVATVTSPLPK
jgi:hypothetical protein